MAETEQELIQELRGRVEDLQKQVEFLQSCLTNTRLAPVEVPKNCLPFIGTPLQPKTAPQPPQPLNKSWRNIVPRILEAERPGKVDEVAKSIIDSGRTRA